MRKRETQGIGTVINEYIKALGLEARLKENSVLNSWEDILGKSVARATSKIYYKDFTLYVKIDSSVVKNEVMMLKDEIIKRMNNEAGFEMIKKMIIY